MAAAAEGVGGSCCGPQCGWGGCFRDFTFALAVLAVVGTILAALMLGGVLSYSGLWGVPPVILLGACAGWLVLYGIVGLASSCGRGRCISTG